jgi:WD40 repeat protein
LGAEDPLLTIDTMVTCVAAKPGHEDIAVTDYLGRVFLIEPEGPRQLAATYGGPLNAVTWLNDTLVTGGYDGILRLWGLDGTEIAAIVAHKAPVKSVVWSPKSQCVITGSSDDTVASWRIDDGDFTMIARLAEPQLVLVNAVATSTARPWVAVGSRDRRIRLWLPDGSCGCTLLPLVHDKSVKTIDVHYRGDLIVSGSYDGTLCFWRLDENDRLVAWRQERLHGKPGVSKVVVDEGTVYSVGWDGTVARWSLNAELLEHLAPSALTSGALMSAGVSRA